MVSSVVIGIDVLGQQARKFLGGRGRLAHSPSSSRMIAESPTAAWRSARYSNVLRAQLQRLAMVADGLLDRRAGVVAFLDRHEQLGHLVVGPAQCIDVARNGRLMIDQLRNALQTLAGDALRRRGVARCEHVGHVAGHHRQVHAVCRESGRIVDELPADFQRSVSGRQAPGPAASPPRRCPGCEERMRAPADIAAPWETPWRAARAASLASRSSSRPSFALDFWRTRSAAQVVLGTRRLPSLTR